MNKDDKMSDWIAGRDAAIQSILDSGMLSEDGSIIKKARALLPQALVASIRNAALEEAAVVCENMGAPDESWVQITCAEKIRSLIVK